MHRLDTPKPPPSPERLAAVSGVILDCDGVLTDRGLFYDNQGSRLLRFDARDGFGIAALCRTGTPVGVLSGRTTDIAELRLRELGVSHWVGRCHDKATGVRRMCADMGIEASRCAFVGDDVPDLAAFSAVSLPIAVADAASELLDAALWVTCAPGGHGAVREIAEAILKAQGVWERLLERIGNPSAHHE